MRKFTALLGTAFAATAMVAATGQVVPAQAAPVSVQAVTTVHVKAVSEIDSNEPKSATATCPAGMVVTGGGFSTATGVGNDGSVVMDELLMRDTSVSGTAYEDADGTSKNWGVTVFAVCANPLPGYEIKLGRSAVIGSEHEKTAVATCSPGKSVMGGGFALTGATGDVVVDELLPGTSTVSTKAFEGKNGTTKNWFLDAYAVCAFQPTGWQIVNKAGPVHSSGKITTLECPAGKKVLGPMFDLTGSLGQAHMLSVLPQNVLREEVSIGALEDDDGTTNSWGLNNWQICAN
ncbi:hypothetical protein [Lentzea sp. CC55]|uniref:hypothetical protein n=1 Tax=Lentzea sp. CC55 TaxID=2884909 RepID=UPI001F27CD5B|nr:hypothetical protein [Lentzea sp. CC55]MCG8921862.1 hypothetical protein [Lentzea sp. CC55]